MRSSLIGICLSIGLLSTAASAIGATTNGATSTSDLPAKKLFKGRINYQLAKAEQLLLDRRYDEATKVFKQQIKRNPKNSDALAGLGMALSMQFKLDGANEQFDKALAVNPNNPVAHVGKAMTILNRLQSSDQTVINSREGLLTQAESEANLAIQEDPGSPLAHYTLGQVHKEQGRLPEAYNDYKNAVGSDPQFSPGYTGMGQIELKDGRLAEADTNLRRSILLNSNNPTAHFALGEVLLQQNMPDAAIKELNIALYQFRNAAPVHLALGKAYEAQGNISAALKYYERAALIKPELKEAYARQSALHVKLGNQCQVKGDTVGALKEYKQALLIDPYNTEPYLKMADMRETRGDLELAVAEMRSGLELNPNEATLRRRVAENLLKLDKYDDAIRDFNSALSSNPGDTAAVNGLTRALYLKSQKETQGAFAFSNDFESALTTLDKAIQLHPNDMQLRLAAAKIRSLSGKPVDLAKVGQPTNDPERIAYAEALLAQNKFDESATQMKDVISHTNEAADLLAVADLALMIKDYDSARAAYEKARTAGAVERANRGLSAIEKSRGEATRYATLGTDLSKKKQLASAVDHLRLAIADDPRMPSARLTLADTEQRWSPKAPPVLRDSARQYKAYLDLSPSLPPKEVAKINKKITRLQLKADKIEAKTKVATVNQ